MNDQSQNYFRYLQNKKVVIGTASLLIIFIPLFFLGIKRASTPATSNFTAPTAVQSQSQMSQVQNENTNIVSSNSVTTASLTIEKITTTSAVVVVDTGSKQVSAIQLAISFDPLIIKNITITPDDFLKRALLLINKIDYSTGTIFYAAVVPPNASPQKGKGVVARLNYTFARGSINPTSLEFLPNTKVTARGTETSILKQSTGITLATDSWQ